MRLLQSSRITKKAFVAGALCLYTGKMFRPVASLSPILQTTTSTSRTTARFLASACDVDGKLVVPDLVSTKGSARILRQATLRNVQGESIILGDYMGTDTSIVVFLRHLA